MHPASFLVRALAVAGLAVFVSPKASATVIYSYTSNAYTAINDSGHVAGSYTTSMQLTASFEFASALGADFDGTATALHYTISDGRNTVSDSLAGAFLRVLDFQTDGSGAITSWEFDFRAPLADYDVRMISRWLERGGLDRDSASLSNKDVKTAIDLGSSVESPGTWSVTGGDPIPAGESGLSLALVGCALLALGLARRSVAI